MNTTSPPCSFLRRAHCSWPALLAAGLFAGTVALASSPMPVSLIPTGVVWRYLGDGTDPGTAWRLPGFDDRRWLGCQGHTGFGDGDETTVLSNNRQITTCFRRSFMVDNAAAFTGLNLWLLVDDGAVVYLNGTEVFRANMPSGTVSYSTLASVEAENAVFTAPLAPGPLLNGANVLAVEVHQQNALSSDMSFDCVLAGTSTAGEPPVLALQPSGKYLHGGDTASLRAEVQGSLPIFCQWLFNEQPISGATNNTLTFVALSTNQAGNYRFVASNAYGLVTSEAAAVTVSVSWPLFSIYQ